MGLLHRALGLRSDAQPARRGPGPRWQQRRQRRGGRGRFAPAGPRVRHRRLRPPPGATAGSSA
jgi:hypothetical protein